ncbi:hypothetical protein [Lentzea fradiae]|uniref:hypothetical protein n=1 Tax=Lentzea fradiae TaxID=200378 RepID=UPI000B7C66A8|nr:hypothetical protein [Lentzea fradiae]
MQRNVGVELEDGDWTVYQGSGDRRKRVDKTVPFVVRNEMQVQAEDAMDRSAIEIVSHPPGVVDLGDWDALKTEIDDTATELDKYGSSSNPFPATWLTGGKPNFYLKPPEKNKTPSFRPFLQMTVGMPLALIPELGRKLREKGVVEITGPYEYTARKLEEKPGPIRGIDEPSAELTGLLELVRSYLIAGDSKSGDLSFKNLVYTMARTDFATMFGMLPKHEQRILRADQESWIAAAMTGLKLGAPDRESKPVFNQTFEYMDRGMYFPYRNKTTRRAWLESMAEPEGRDLLSAGGKAGALEEEERIAALRKDIRLAKQTAKDLEVTNPFRLDAKELLRVLEELHEGLGAYGRRVDYISYEDRPGYATPATILEIRNLKQNVAWRKLMDEVYQCFDEVISQGGKRSYTNIGTAEGRKRKEKASGKATYAEEPEMGGPERGEPEIGEPEGGEPEKEKEEEVDRPRSRRVEVFGRLTGFLRKQPVRRDDG